MRGSQVRRFLDARSDFCAYLVPHRRRQSAQSSHCCPKLIAATHVELDHVTGLTACALQNTSQLLTCDAFTEAQRLDQSLPTDQRRRAARQAFGRYAHVGVISPAVSASSGTTGPAMCISASSLSSLVLLSSPMTSSTVRLWSVLSRSRTFCTGTVTMYHPASRSLPASPSSSRTRIRISRSVPA